MNQHIKLIAIPFLLVGILNSGCKKFLDQVPNDRITIEEVFRKRASSEQFLANIYGVVPPDTHPQNAMPWVSCADEADYTWTTYGNYQVNIGNLNPSNVLYDRWGRYYQGIRSATYFINHINENVEIRAQNGQQLIDQYQAEARFLRAYFYSLLMQQYGPVVLMGEDVTPPDAQAADLQIPRSSFDECVDYVVSELDKAAAVLPILPMRNGQASDAEYGRITKGIALAVKSRLLLYAASPQYNGNKDVASFTNRDGKQLIAQNYNAEKWKKAADAAKAVIDLGVYQLYKDPSGDPIKSLDGIFFNSWNKEQIFVRKSNDLKEWDVHNMPRQAGGWNGIAPTQEVVDAYFMSDGLLPSESRLYSESGFTTVNGVSVYNMYVNREPRFYHAITFNNSIWQGGNMNAPAAISFFASGPNGRNGHPTDFSKTGYLNRKNVGRQTNVGSGGNGQVQSRVLILFRLGEIYLNYAEALNEYQPGSPEIVTYLNAIRERAGVPTYGSGANQVPIPASQAEMRAKIRAERRVELAFEGNRFFDIRRWKIAPQVMGVLHGMDISKNGNDFYKRVPIATIHIFRQSYYWWPITQYEIDRNKELVQNPSW